MKVIKAKFNCYRRPEYRMATLVVHDVTGPYVVKRAMTEEAKPHCESLGPRCKRIQEAYPSITVLRPTYHGGEARFDMDRNPSLQSTLARLLKNNDEQGFKKEIKRYVETISAPAQVVERWWESPEFYEVFGAIGETEMTARRCLAPANIDMGFGNIHIADGQDPCYRLFDCEWTFDFPVPLGYVLWRSLSRFDQAFHLLTLHGWKLSNLYGLAGIDEADIPLYEFFEERFQKYVFGDTLFYGIPDEIVREKPWRNFDDLVSWGAETHRHYEAATARAEAIQKGFETSFSWRITRPMRAVTCRIKRLLGRS